MQPSQNIWLHRCIRFGVFKLVQLFYPKIEVRGYENLASNGPLIFVSNHPNGLLDPLLLMVGLNRPISFLAKSTLFGNPVGRTFSEIFGALPIYRKQDEGLASGPRGDAKARNEVTFARARALLSRRGALALFPEGTTHSGSQLLPLRTGAARIAVSAEQAAEWRMGVQIVPVGLWYQSKTQFRTSVLLVVGQPFELLDYAANYAADEYETVRLITDRIEAGLDAVVLQAENAELLAAIPVVAAWTAPEGRPPALPEQHEWTAELLSAYERLYRTDPARLEMIAQQARRYAHTLQTLGINNPWTLELPTVKQWHLARLVLGLGMSLPVALAGFVLSYVPYRLAGPVAVLIIGQYETQISTFKLVGGALFVLLGWILEAVVCGIWFGALWGGLLFVVAPPLSYLTLRWGEAWRELRALLSGRWWQWQRGDLVWSLVAQRQALAKQVMEAVRAAS